MVRVRNFIQCIASTKMIIILGTALSVGVVAACTVPWFYWNKSRRRSNNEHSAGSENGQDHGSVNSSIPEGIDTRRLSGSADSYQSSQIEIKISGISREQFLRNLMSSGATQENEALRYAEVPENRVISVPEIASVQTTQSTMGRHTVSEGSEIKPDIQNTDNSCKSPIKIMQCQTNMDDQPGPSSSGLHKTSETEVTRSLDLPKERLIEPTKSTASQYQTAPSFVNAVNESIRSDTGTPGATKSTDRKYLSNISNKLKTMWINVKRKRSSDRSLEMEPANKENLENNHPTSHSTLLEKSKEESQQLQNEVLRGVAAILARSRERLDDDYNEPTMIIKISGLDRGALHDFVNNTNFGNRHASSCKSEQSNLSLNLEMDEWESDSIDEDNDNHARNDYPETDTPTVDKRSRVRHHSSLPIKSKRNHSNSLMSFRPPKRMTKTLESSRLNLGDGDDRLNMTINENDDSAINGYSSIDPSSRTSYMSLPNTVNENTSDDCNQLQQARKGSRGDFFESVSKVMDRLSNW
ncbi:uncharacterized protein LOC107269433 [Cephus cinctus]|uniref:Uncharacterized protein LOC107269433 n=1 Tax=Cephus cinctus TaxID=211228 RepID=A0AAJ7C085_CEPCN|nr:uncharacterized protein LOC107269433 [Cephus cinctus]